MTGVSGFDMAMLGGVLVIEGSERMDYGSRDTPPPAKVPQSGVRRAGLNPLSPKLGLWKRGLLQRLVV